MASSPIKICDLPDEVLCYIFSKLNVEHVIKSVMNVCQRWKSVVAENKIFWNNLQLTIDCDYFIDHSYLDEESIRLSYHEDNLPCGPTEMFIGEKDLEKVPKLQSIKLSGGNKIIHQSVDLLIRIVDIISKTCKEIENIQFFFCFGATLSQFIRFLGERYENIKEIRYDFSDLHKIPYDEISRFANLNTLVSHDKMFKTSDLYVLAEGCEHLHSLWILFYTSLETDGLMYFLEKKKNSLKELGIGIRLQDSVLVKLKECHLLEVFFASNASYITDDCIKSFAELSSLKYCSLHQARFQRTTIFEIASLCRKPETFKHLKILDLSGFYHYNAEFFNSWNDQSTQVSKAMENTKGTNIQMGPIDITFSNPISNRTITQVNFHDSRVHYMYQHCLQ